jgi:hypothetical protein
MMRTARHRAMAEHKADTMKRIDSPTAEAATRKKKFEVGELVDVYCDHNRELQRVREWLQGVVVQADYKMVAVQFLQDVYLTDGWMVPDRVLWCQQGGEMIRPSVHRRLRKATRKRRS